MELKSITYDDVEARVNKLVDECKQRAVHGLDDLRERFVNSIESIKSINAESLLGNARFAFVADFSIQQNQEIREVTLSIGPAHAAISPRLHEWSDPPIRMPGGKYRALVLVMAMEDEKSEERKS